MKLVCVSQPFKQSVNHEVHSMLTKKIVERPCFQYSSTLAMSESLDILCPALALEFGKQLSCKNHACILHIRLHLGFVCNEPRPENVNSLDGISARHRVGTRRIYSKGTNKESKYSQFQEGLLWTARTHKRGNSSHLTSAVRLNARDKTVTLSIICMNRRESNLSDKRSWITIEDWSSEGKSGI